MTIRLISAIAAALFLSGCASSPVALEEANHGLSLTTQLRQELARYAGRLAAVDDMRQRELDDNIAANKERLLDIAGDDQLYEFSGQGKRLSAIKQLRGRVALLRAAAPAREGGTAHGGDLIGQRVPSLPAVDDSLGATGKAFGALGLELPFAERAALAASFFEEVRDEVKQNQNAAASIAAAAAKNLAVTTATSPSTVK
ncbi:MAG: hypothetical protein V4484_24115 [Pseudomonadota bacterium]